MNRSLKNLSITTAPWICWMSIFAFLCIWIWSLLSYSMVQTWMIVGMMVTGALAFIFGLVSFFTTPPIDPKAAVREDLSRIREEGEAVLEQTEWDHFADEPGREADNYDRFTPPPRSDHN